MNDNFYKQLIGESPTEQLETRLKENEEKEKRAAELIIANTELVFQNEENLYISHHDYLTGLYNRRYFEAEIKRLDTPRQLPI